MDAGVSIIILILIVAALATLIRFVSKAIRMAKRAQIKYEKDNPTHYL